MKKKCKTRTRKRKKTKNKTEEGRFECRFDTQGHVVQSLLLTSKKKERKKGRKKERRIENKGREWDKRISAGIPRKDSYFNLYHASL